MAGRRPQFPTRGGNRGGYPTNLGEQSYDEAYTYPVSSQIPGQSPHAYFPPQIQGYHYPQGQSYSSPQLSSGHQFPKQGDVSEQPGDTSGLLSSSATRPYRSPSVASNNSNYTLKSLTTELHNKYFMRNEQGFFKAGRVFACLWAETLGETAWDKKTDNPNYTRIKYQQYAFSDIQRFVVIYPNFLQHFSICCPINTYGFKGTAKNPGSHHQHAIIYTGESEPLKLATELEFEKLPIKMEPCSPRAKLHSRSRLNFGKPTAVQHNLRVEIIGDITPQHLQNLFQYFVTEQEGMLANARYQILPSSQRESLEFHSPPPDLAGLSLSSETGIADAPPGVGTFAGTQETTPEQTLAPSGYVLNSTAPPLESSGPESQVTGMLQHMPDPAFYQPTYVSHDMEPERIEEYNNPSPEIQRSRGSTVPQPSSRRESRPNQRTKSDMTEEQSRRFKEQGKAKGGRKTR